MNLNVKRFGPLLFLFIVACGYEGNYSTPTTRPFKVINCDNKCSRINHLDIKICGNNCQQYQKSDYYAYFTVNDFQFLFANALNDNEILSNHALYAYPEFCAYARTLSDYKDYIRGLQALIKNNKQFKKSTECVPGFSYNFGIGWTQSGFHDFVNKEANNNTVYSQKNASPKKLNLSDANTLETLNQEWLVRRQSACDKTRLTERIDALHKIRQQYGNCFDYSDMVSHLNINDPYYVLFSNTYGTALDYQLHKELLQVHDAVAIIEKKFVYDQRVQLICPILYHYTAQAKKEELPEIAFEISDFCHSMVEMLSHGMHIVHDTGKAFAKGVGKGIAQITCIDHWKDLATAPLYCALWLADIAYQERELLSAVLMIKPLNNLQIHELGERFQLRSNSAYQTMQEYAKNIREKTGDMLWPELIESAAEIGTTIILDTVMLGIVGKCAHATRGYTIKQFNKLAESGLLFTKQYAVEAAGFGKLVIEEGVDLVPKAADIIKQDIVSCMDSPAVLNKVRAQLTPERWLEFVEYKIRNVGDDILDIMEKAGGHTLEKHVSEPHWRLLSRAIGAKKEAITTFISKKIATRAVKENLRHNAKEIALWLRTDPIPGTRKIFEFVHSNTIGTGVIKRKKNGLCKSNVSRLALEPSSTNSLGFKIITFFPVLI